MIRIIDATPKEEYILYLQLFAKKLSILEKNSGNTMSPTDLIAAMLESVFFNKEAAEVIKMPELISIRNELDAISQRYEMAGTPMTYDEFITNKRDKTLNEMGI